MRSILAVLVFLAVTAVAAVRWEPAPAAAQQTFVATEEFVVARGSTLWDLALEKCGNALRWREIYDLNTNLETGRRLSYRRGRPIVMIYPGERLTIPTAGCELASTIVVAAPETRVVQTQPPPPQLVERAVMPWWAWLLLAATIAATVWLLIDRRRLKRIIAELRALWEEHRKDERERFVVEMQRRAAEEAQRHPVHQMTDLEVRAVALAPRKRGEDEPAEGPAFVPGGITAETLDPALRRAAQIEFVRQTRGMVPRLDTIWVREGVLGCIVEGTYYVVYADGSRGPDQRVERDDAATHVRAWRVVAEGENGEEVVTYVLTICANGMGRPIGAEDDIVFVPDEEQPKYAIPLTANEVILRSTSPITIELGGRRLELSPARTVRVTVSRDDFYLDRDRVVADEAEVEIVPEPEPVMDEAQPEPAETDERATSVAVAE